MGHHLAQRKAVHWARRLVGQTGVQMAHWSVASLVGTKGVWTESKMAFQMAGWLTVVLLVERTVGMMAARLGGG